MNTLIAFDPVGRKQKPLKMTEWTNFSPLCRPVSLYRYCHTSRVLDLPDEARVIDDRKRDIFTHPR